VSPRLSSWQDFVGSAPEFASRVQELFTAHKHHTMATLRRDGSPRISGTEVDFDEGELRLGMMAGTYRAEDLRRDPRIEIHSQGVDPPDGDPGAWSGEAKLSGRAVELPAAQGQSSDRFRVDVAQVVLTRVGTPADHLVIERWTPDGGLVRSERH
jgi:hypothetical protein